MDTNNLIVWLPFDASTTTDHCGNGWKWYYNPNKGGSVSIRDNQLFIQGTAWLQMDSQIKLTGGPFTVSCRFSTTTTPTESSLLGDTAAIWQLYNSGLDLFGLYIYPDEQVGVFGMKTGSSVCDGQWHHAEFDYDGSTVYFFLDGQLVGSKERTISNLSYTLYVGHNYWTHYSYNGAIDEFMIYDGVALHTENFTPPTDDDYFDLKIAKFGSVHTSEVADMERIVCNNPDNIDRDACYKFTRASDNYASIPIEVLGGATEFTIEIKFATTYTTSTSTAYRWGNLIGRDIPYTGAGEISLAVNDGKLCLWGWKSSQSSYKVTSDAIVNDGQIHVAAVRSNADGSLDLFCDGELVSHANDANALITKAYTLLISQNQDAGQASIAMDFYEARLWRVARDDIFADIEGDEDGLAAWYLPTPTGIFDYSTHARHATVYGATYAWHVVDTADFQRVLTNDALAWRYEDRTVYIGTGNPITFHIPRVAELWAKFSVFFDGLNRWFASDQNGNGLAAHTSLALDFTANDSNAATFQKICTPLQTQKFLLHMRAGVDDGLIEAWADGKLVGEFTGNVNNGKPFENFNLRSEDAGTSFTDLIVSNQTILPDATPSNQQRTYQLTYLHLKHYIFTFTAKKSSVSHYVNLAEKIRAVTTTIFKPIISLWIKFDVTSDGVDSWRAYNDGEAGISGIYADEFGDIDFIADSATVNTALDVCAGKQTFILHMESDAAEGLIELFCDGELVGSYTGNVNDGDEFTDVYLVDESDTLFENFIVSSEPLSFDSESREIAAQASPPTLTLNIFHAGEIISVPLTTAASAPAVTVRKLGVDWFAPLCESDSPVKIFVCGKELGIRD